METTNTTINSVDRVLLPFKYNEKLMLQEFETLKEFHFKNYEYYDVIPLRAPAHMVDSSIPFPPPADDYADGSWTEWLNTKELEDSPYLKNIVEEFQKHTKVTLVRLLRLAPDSIVKEHTDPTLALEVEKSVIRLTIPIQYGEEVTFYLNNTPVPMKSGECWYLKLNDPHKITNFGTTERVSLTIDIIPNQWIKDTIEKSIT